MLTDPASSRSSSEEHEVDFSYAISGPRPLPRERLPAARLDLARLPRASPEIKSVEELLLPHVIYELADEERGVILLTGTTGSGKSTTLAAMIDRSTPRREAHRDDRGPGRVPPHGQAVDHQPARGGGGHRLLRARPPPRAAPGPGRDPDRRDARRGDRAHRPVRGRDRPPRALHDPHRGRGRDREPDHRLLPGVRAAPGARDARRHAQGRRSPSGSCPRPTARAA